MSDRLDLLKPLITPAVMKMAQARFFARSKDDAPLLVHRQKLTDAKYQQVKLALLLVHQWNPFQDFTVPEQSVLRGIKEDTITNRRQLKPESPDYLRRL